MSVDRSIRNNNIIMSVGGLDRIPSPRLINRCKERMWKGMH